MESGTEITNHLGTIVLAAGAVGIAAAGIVDGLKWSLLRLSGFEELRGLLGKPLWSALRVAYGPQACELLQAQYRAGRAKGELDKTLRQGIRIGLTADNAEAIANDLGVVQPKVLVAAAKAITGGKNLDEAGRAAVGRYELAGDARIRAGLALAEERYAATARLAAMVVAIALSLAAAAWLHYEAGKSDAKLWLAALIVGIAAVPLAPIAKDVASGIQAASKALRKR